MSRAKVRGMQAPPIASKLPRIATIARRPTEPRCSQCGELLELAANKHQPDLDRALCVDCAFDAIPCTD
jgi:hypothetical protein